MDLIRKTHSKPVCPEVLESLLVLHLLWVPDLHWYLVGQWVLPHPIKEQKHAIEYKDLASY